MTRGRMILVENEKNKLQEHYSCVFKEDMFNMIYGEIILYNLRDVKKLSEFEQYVFYFNDHHFGYPDSHANVTTEEIENNSIDIENFIYDYLYVKNISEEEIVLKIRRDEEKVLKPNEVAVLENKELEVE